MKKLYLFLGISLVAGSMTASADNGVIVNFSDGTSTFYPADQIASVEFTDEYESPAEQFGITDNIRNAAADATLQATAIVTAQSSRGLILTDKGGSILYYDPSIDLTSYPLGTVVNVSGEVIDYFNCLEFTNTATIEAIGRMEATYPTPIAYTPAMIDEAAASGSSQAAEYCTISGTIDARFNYTTGDDHSYRIKIKGTEVLGWLYFPSPEIESQVVMNHNFNITGYFLNVDQISINGEYYQKFNVLATEIEDLGKAEEEPIPSETKSYLQYTISPIELENSYIFGYIEGDIVKIANPISSSSSFGYLGSEEIPLEENNTVVWRATESEDARITTRTTNQFLFTANCSGTVPEGNFLIQDAYGRYLSLQGSYYSFNVSKQVETDDFNNVMPNYLFSASLEEDGSWSITNQYNGTKIYFDINYNNFAAYTEDRAADTSHLPVLFTPVTTR